jgi:integrase
VNPRRRNSRGRLAASTHREYRRSLELHILPRIGHLKLTEINPLILDQLIHDLEDDGIAAGTIRNAFTPVRKMLSDAHKNGLLPANPAFDLDLPPAPDSIGKELPAVHTQAIRKALIELAPPNPFNPDEKDLVWVHYYDLLLGTAMRPGELQALHWDDIDIDERLIRVRQSMSRRRLKTPKTPAGVRSIPIFPTVHTALNDLQQRAKLFGIHQPEQLLFQTASGQPLHASNFNRRVWQPALSHAGLTGIDGRTLYRVYDLRHTTISRLIAAGADIKLTQTIAGHANPQMTLARYAHVTEARLSDTAERFDPAS